VSGREFREPFDSVSMCIMEMFDKATFAQVPVELTGDPAQPVRVRPDADGEYKVGTSPLWRLGKKMLGFSVPMRFAARRAVPRRQGVAGHGHRHQGDVGHARRLTTPDDG
jgi:sulfide:quinone oxidoreductase